MKKFSAFLSLCLILFFPFISCSNFLSQSDFIEELNKAIDYANRDYADVTIAALNSYTESINPPAANYSDRYKAGDVISLSLTVKAGYQFVEWKSTGGDVTFADSSSLVTTATINKSDSPITIEPVVCERPTVSFLPKNAVAVEKNSSVVITFSHEINLTDEVTLDLIKITNEYGTEIQNENFLPPQLDETKKVVTFDANPDNLLVFDGNTLNLTVIVPASFHYLYGQKQIFLQQDNTYTFTVNQQTLSKLNITVTNPDANKGNCNINGEYALNLGQVQNLNFSILQEYAFTGWVVKDAAGNTLLPEAYKQFFTIADVTKAETTVTALKVGSGFVIEPECVKRAQVVASTPVYEKTGVNRASDIRILFDQDMSEDSIGKSGDLKNIQIYKRGDSSFSLKKYFGSPYFETPSILVIPTVKDKNNILPAFTDIEVVIGKGFVNSKGIEIAREYTCCYRTNGGHDIDGPKFKWQGKDEEGIWNLNGTKPYNGIKWDLISNNPKVIDTPEEEREENAYFDKRPLKEDEMEKVFLSADSFSTLETEYKIQDTKSVTVDGWITIEDESGIEEIVLTLTPVPNKLYPKQTSEKYSVIHSFTGEKKLVFGSTDPNATEDEKKKLEFDLSELETEGIYKLGFSVIDVIGNVTEPVFYSKIDVTMYVFNGEDWIPYSSGAMTFSPGVYCIVDNVFDTDFSYSYEKPEYNDRRYDITGSVGKYYLYQGDLKATSWSQNYIREWSRGKPLGKAEITSENQNIYLSKIDNRNNPFYSSPAYLIVEDLFGNFSVKQIN